MWVRLLKDVTEDRPGGKVVKVTARPGRRPVHYHEGAVVNVSEATALKWQETGLAEPYDGRGERPPTEGDGPEGEAAPEVPSGDEEPPRPTSRRRSRRNSEE